MKFYQTNLALALHRLLHVLVTVLVAAVCMTSSAFAQPVEAAKQGTEAVETKSSAGAETGKDKTKKQKDEQAKPKKEKRGSLVIAPIPISSPAFGSGLLLITGYVFKVGPNDKESPPSFLGGA